MYLQKANANRQHETNILYFSVRRASFPRFPPPKKKKQQQQKNKNKKHKHLQQQKKSNKEIQG